MKLDRNLNADGRGKYGLILNRKLGEALERRFDGGDGDVADLHAIKEAVALLERAGVIDWGTTRDTEFFVLRLRDHNAARALHGYASHASMTGDFELGNEVTKLAIKAGGHPNRKRPD